MLLSKNRAALGALLLSGLVLTGCSRASLLGGPGPEVAHHASPAESERLALLEAVRKFETKDECKSHIAQLAHVGEDQLVKVSDAEVRAYHSAGEGASIVHHEYSCVGKQMLERSWTGHKSGIAHAPKDATDLAPEVH